MEMSEPFEHPLPAEASAMADAGRPLDEEALIEEDLLIEDVSIDGMCGVY
jgi:mycofactocin precursor